MRTLFIEGDIIPNDYQEIYDWLGWSGTSPKKVQSVLDDVSGSVNPNEEIEVKISSGGGSVMAGNDIYSALRDYPGQINIKIIFAASAASVIAMARHSVAVPTAMIMIHNASSGAQGDYHEMDRTSEMLQKVNQAMSAAYREKTGMSEDELLKLMDKETWLTADRALELGFIDEISGKNQQTAAASYDGLPSEAQIKKYRKQMAAEAAARRFKALEESH